MQAAQALSLEVFKQESSLRMGLFAQNEPHVTLKHYNQVPVSFLWAFLACDSQFRISGDLGQIRLGQPPIISIRQRILATLAAWHPFLPTRG